MMLPTATIPTDDAGESPVGPSLTMGSLVIDSLEVTLRPPLTFAPLDRRHTTWREHDLGLRLATPGRVLDSRQCGDALLPALAAFVTHAGADSLQARGAVVWSRVREVTDTSTVTGLVGGRAVSLQEFRAALVRYAHNHE